MTDTPVCDFVRRYVSSDAVRLHMPGHKGQPFLGAEPLDITEIDGADTLYVPHGIIRESERNASRRFGCDTFYSTEGASQCIRAMLYLAVLYTGNKKVLAGRNAHSTFLTAAALLDLDVRWLHPHPGEGYCQCTVTPADLDKTLTKDPVGAVYITSPDYPGNTADVAALSAVCRLHGALLLVDGAHGAYLHFLPQPLHPSDCGADLCCSSAHKTLPVLTGGAYLHVGKALRESVLPHVRQAMALFGSTSPSYLILQSLDRTNAYLQTYPETLAAFLPEMTTLKARLCAHGYTLCGSEPLKITVQAKPFGYTGSELAQILREENIFCEFHDADYLTAMCTPANSADDLRRFGDALCAVQKKPAVEDDPPAYHLPETVCSPRETLFAPREVLPLRQCIGRVLASYALSCPPAVPVVLCGERIDEKAAAALRYYGVTECAVLTERTAWSS